MIAEITKEVEEVCRNEKNKFGYGIWSHHIVTVVEYSKKLAEVVGADTEIVEVAALLHDYASIMNYAMYEEHHLHSATEAEIILKEYDYPTERIERVKECIWSHRGSVVLDKQSKEAECVADADAIAHIVNVPSLLYLSYKIKGMTIDEGNAYVKGKLERSWAKLSAIAKDLVRVEYESAIVVLAS